MDLPKKLLDLLHTKSLYFGRADDFVDRLEGALFPSFRKGIEQANANRVQSTIPIIFIGVKESGTAFASRRFVRAKT